MSSCTAKIPATTSLPARRTMQSGDVLLHSRNAAAPQYGIASCSAGSRKRNSLCDGKLYVASCSTTSCSNADLHRQARAPIMGLHGTREVRVCGIVST